MFNNYFFSLLFFLTVNFQFFSQVNASFSSDVTAGCSPLQVNFSDNSTNSLGNKWDFGNGSPIVSNNNNPISTYSNPGLYTVTLIAFNGGDSDTIVMVDYIEVYEKPTSDFTYSSTNLCEDDNLLTFTNSSIGASSFLWDFGDGNSSTDPNPTHLFLQTGDFTIKLNAYNANCADLKTIGPITIHPTPILNASADTTFTCDSNFNFTFSGSSLNTTITNWEWSFGNGISIVGTGTQAYSYNETGSFSPKLIATSNNGCVDSTFLNPISISQIDSYTIQPTVNTGCPPLDVDFNITPSSSIQNSNWNFGDTNTSTAVSNSSNTYLNSGNFSVSSIITDINGCIQNVNMNGLISVDTSPTGTFTTSNSIGCPPLNVNFSVTTDPSNTIAWDFGDTTFSSNIVDNNTYLYSGTFYPELTLTSPNGCIKTYIVDTIQAGLTLTNFNASPTTGCAALEVNFTNTAPANATSFLWEFGDGNTSTDPNPTHIYDTIGEYSVKFTCSDTSGCSSTYIINNMITTFGEEDVNLPNPDTIEVCSPYTFEADASSIGESYWNWDFGDGNYGSGANVSHVYTQSGSYTVLLNADAPNACMYNITNYAVINVNNMNIDLDISINDDCSVGTFSVNNNSTGVIQHQWNMGDFNGYNTENITHPYNTSSSYMVTYEALSSTGCVVTKYFPVVFNCDANGDPVVDPPPPIIEPPTDDTVVISIQGPLVDPITNDQITQTCGPELIELSSPFPNAISFHWDFGDGNTSTEQDPSNYYSDSGLFDLTHIATYANGDKDTLTILGFIDQYILDASFVLNKTPLCNEADFQFTNLSTFATSWEWTLDSTIISSQSNGSINLPLNDSVKILNLKIEDDYGCIDERQQSLFLYQPLVLIEQDTFACNSSNINFECSVVGDPIHSWDLDDGTILGPDTTISHSYNQNGFYHVVLSLDDQGCVRDINLDSLEVYQPDATFSPLNVLPICNRDSVLFIANDRSFTNGKYEWSGAKILGNGDSTWIQFNSPGQQVVSLSIKNRTCRNTVNSDTIIVNKANAYFSSTQLNGCIPIDVTFQDFSINPVDWQWSFGDGNTSNNQNPAHTYQSMPTDSINLTITDINGCKDSIRSVIINELNAEFTVNDSVVCTNTPVIFSGVDNVVSNWNWDFGDGNTSTDSVPTHYYQTGGFFEVKLIVSDGQGCNDTVIKTSYIEVQNVEADFTFSAPGTCPPIITTFNNNSTGASDYIWDFGDGANNIINNNPTVTHTYDSSGNYSLSLIANNSGGCSDTLVLIDSLVIPGPQLNFSIDQTIGCDSLTINISDSSINTVTYKWDFNDGNGDSLNINPSHTYTTIGTYAVSLVGIDASGCGTLFTSSDTVKIYPSPIIDVSIIDSNLCYNTSLVPLNNTTADIHSWTYGSQAYNSSNPSILIDVSGITQLDYIATNNDGNCSSNTSFDIISHQIPDVSIIDQGIICSNTGIVDYNSLNSNVLTTISWSGIGITDTVNGLLDPLLITDSSIITASFDSICLSQDSIYVVVDNPPDATILTPNTTYCSLDIISDPQVLNTGGTWIGTNVNPSTGGISSALSPGVYEYLYILNNTNCTDSSSYELEILYQNDATITSDSTVCENAGSYILNSVDTGGTWSGPFINSNSGIIDINSVSAGNYEYIYSISGTCPDIDTLNLQVLPFIAAQINPSISYCEGTDSIQLSATTNIGNWSGLMNSHSNNGWFLTSQIPDGTYEVYYTITSQCPDEDTLELTILPEPDIDVTINQELPCIGFPVSIVNNSLNLSLENYDWFVNDSLYFQNFNEPYFVFDTGYYEIKTVAINQFNCENNYTFIDLVNVYDTAALVKAEIIRSTVFENKSVYTEWKDTSLVMNPLGTNLLYRSINNGNYNLLIELDSNIHSYLDTEVDVFNNNYSYYVISKNVCEVNSINSNYGNSILLEFEKPEEFKTKLNWNIYNNWDDGINRYEIQKLNENGQWELFLPSENLNNSIIIDE